MVHAESIHSLVERWATATPHATAVATGDARVSYLDLNQRANDLAWRLHERGVGLESRVAIMLERGIDAVVALLATLKAGAAYVPIDPEYPQERRSAMLADAHAAAVIAAEQKAADVACGYDVVVTVSPAGGGRADGPPVHAGGGNSAYLVYTSGSTGQPKGVVVEHRAVVSLVMKDPRLAVGAGDLVAQFAPIAFDASTFEIWGALCRGGQLVILDGPQVSIEELGRQLRLWRPQWFFLTTGLFHLLADLDADALCSVGCLLTGGDVLSPQYIHIAASLDGARVYAAYGPTETTTFASLHHADAAADYRQVPIGSALRGSTMYVLDPGLAPVPDGQIGELYIGGDGLARCYHRQPGLTAGRFVPDPFCGVPGARMYRTGDLARRRGDGEFEFHGRIDRQVKIRGFRIEPGEVETALARHPCVGTAVVTAVHGAPGKRLAAYLVRAPGQQVSVSDLRAWVSRLLPAYAVPSAFVVMDRLPVDRNGKVDRSALPAPWKSRDKLADLPPYEPARSELERTIVAAWAEALDIDTVGLQDNFFELGGDSLVSVSVLDRLRGCGIELTAGEFFRNPTVAELAALVHAATGTISAASGAQGARIRLQNTRS